MGIVQVGSVTLLLCCHKRYVWLIAFLSVALISFFFIWITALVLHGQVLPNDWEVFLIASLLLACVVSLFCTNLVQSVTHLQIIANVFESQEGMVIANANSTILNINHSFTRITGYTAQEAIGQKMKLLKSGVHDATFYQAMWHSIVSTNAWQGEIWNKRKNGEIYPEWLTITAVKNNRGLITHYVGTMIDITARKAFENHIRHLAHYDVLTDLPNRTLLHDRLHQALAQMRRDNLKLALMFIDLNDFKLVNDAFGHEVGDLLLKSVALRLLQCVKRETDTVSRVGGDEFVVVLSDIAGKEDVMTIAQSIERALRQTFLINRHSIHVACSIGISFYPQDGEDAHTLMRLADVAMYAAKHTANTPIKFYSADTMQSSHSNLTATI